MSMDVNIFNVGRGLCVAIRTPNNYLIMIDCGRSEDFSPVRDCLYLNRQYYTTYKDHYLTELIITHPHLDHLADIENITEFLSPGIIWRRKNLKWNHVISGGSGQTEVMNHYKENYMPPRYDEEVTDPDWGNGFYHQAYCLSLEKLNEISPDDNDYVNNSSFVTVVKYKGYTFVFNGDILKEGLSALLRENSDLVSEIRDSVHFYLTPHHGHESGFSKEWFEKTGPTKIFNISSERRCKPGESPAQTEIDSNYSDKKYSLGGNKAGRYAISTKRDDHITISISDNGKWSWVAGDVI